MRHPAQQRLVELALAAMLLGAFAAFAYRALEPLLDSRANIERERRKWREVERFIARVEQQVASASIHTVPAGSAAAPAVASFAAVPRRGPNAVPAAPLDGITAAHIRYLDARGSWHDAWPPASPPGGTARVALRAIEVTVTLVSGERVSRLLPTNGSISP